MTPSPCDDFRRGDLLRRAAAQAGRGLPAIEPGMPLPAGTGMDRRAFLLRTAGLGLSVYAAGRIGGTDALTAGVAHAADAGAAPVILNVFLEGGIDGLSVLAPVDDGRYRSARPRLALSGGGTRFSEDDRLMWHPSAAALATLHGEGKLSVLPAVGYAGADQSHFTSRHYWEVGATDTRLRTGWIGRWLDTVGSPDNPVQGLALDGQLSPVLASARVPVAAIDGLGDHHLGARGVWGPVGVRMQQAVGELGGVHISSDDAALRQAGQAAGNVARMADLLAPFKVDPDQPPPRPVPYPDDADSEFPEQLAALAWLLSGGLPVRAAALRGPGAYDTHERQAETFGGQVRLLSESLLAFQRDLEARGLADRVLTVVWSEFGRRVEENGSAGTDHGAAGIGFILGSRAAGRMVGEFPGLATVDGEGNLRSTVDFRCVYASLLEQWLGADAAPIIPGAGRLPRVRLVR